MQQSLLFWSILILSLLSACSVEEAHVSEDRRLVIASDYLAPTDSLLFHSFIEENDVELQIISMTPTQIQQQLIRQDANSGIDVVMLQSVYHVSQLRRENALQNVHPEDYPRNARQYISKQFNYIGIGIDPFVLAKHRDNPGKIGTYEDLTRETFINDLSTEENIVMLAPVLQKLPKVKANVWVKQFNDYGVSRKSSLDSVGKYAPVLTTLTRYDSEPDSASIYFKKDLIFPNNSTTGTFYNLRTICIVHQAENYAMATVFAKHYTGKEENDRINEQLGTLSIYARSSKFRPYSVPKDELIPYFSMAKRLLKRLPNE